MIESQLLIPEVSAAEARVGALLDSILDYESMPETVCVTESQADSLLGAVCDELNISLEIRKTLPAVEVNLQRFDAYMLGPTE